MPDYDNTTLIADIATHLNAVRECLGKLEVDKLPYVLIEDIHIAHLLPSTSAIYFLSHPDKGLVYIGTASNLQGRWSFKRDIAGQVSVELTHHCLDPAVNLGNVRLSWWSVPKGYLPTVESFLIRDLSPKWNTRGRTGGKATNDKREYSTKEREYRLERQKELARIAAERAQYEEEVKRKKAERRRKLEARRRLRKRKWKESRKKVTCTFCYRDFLKLGLKTHERYCKFKAQGQGD